ncbi:MAG: NAD-dependent epimerase/dehydratase family protein [Candidatus Nanoarchaeia archaeon]
MDVLVTGGAGFIGSNIVKKLVGDGYNVTVLDNLHTGSEVNLFFVKGKVKLIKKSTGELKNLTEKFDIIFHNGIYSSSPMYKENPGLVGVVINEFLLLLEYARKNDSKIIFASSSSLYNTLQPPHREDMDIKVTDLYTEARLTMERLGEAYYKIYGNRIIGLRYFSVYGPHEENKGKYANLISQFLWALQKDQAPVVFGDGTQERDFIYVDDVVEANLIAMKSNIDFGVFNIGTGKSTKLNEIISILNAKLNKQIKPKYVSNPIKNYVYCTLADTTKAEQVLGFKAKVDLNEGIDKLLQYYKKHLKIIY